MPAPSFRTPEADFLRTQLAEWQRMKSIPVNKGNVDSLLRERRQFIRDVTSQLLAKFPDRDPSVSDPSSITYTTDDLERLPEKLRQWFRNNSRSAANVDTKKKRITQKRTHARNLAAKRYSQQIKEIAGELREVDKSLKPMTAFNRATTRFLNTLKEEDTEAYEKLQQDAKEMREASTQDYTELSPEVLASLLEKFPKQLLKDIEQYGKELPVHIWCIAAFAKPPLHELEAFTLCTPSLDAMSNSEFDRTTRRDFLAWIQENLGYYPRISGNDEGLTFLPAGAKATLQVDTAAPMVYPSLRQGARPSLPQVENLHKVSAHQLRAWLRIYFNYHYMWQGGTQSVPWKILSQDRKFKYILEACFPPGVKALISPNDMNRSQLEQWYQWILNGQHGQLRRDQVFRFIRIDRGALGSLAYPNPISTRPEACNLIWGPEEKLYAARVQDMTQKAQLDPNWHDLPLARLHCVYDPFAEKVRAAMSNGCLSEYRSREIVDLLFEHERYGPVHTQDAQCTEVLNAYIDPSLSEEHIMRLLLGPPLSPAALLVDKEDHSDLALATLVHYARTTKRFRHSSSKTWRGGPFGVRWIVAIYVYFAAAFSVYERSPQNLPTDRIEAFDACHFSRLKLALVNFGLWLLESLRDSISVLKRTFRDRAEAWRQAVVVAHLNDPDSSIGNESVTLNTHGLPRSRSTLRTCYEELQAQDPDLTMGKDSAPQQHLRRRVRKKAEVVLELDEEELSDHDSTSGEDIEFPSDSGEDTHSEWNNQVGKDDDGSDLELGLYHSRVITQGSLQGSDAEGKPEHTEDGDASHALGDEPTLPEDLQFPEPAIQEDDGNHADGETDEELPSQILAGLSPRKPLVGTPSKSKSRMIMEVVINTPSKRSKSKEPTGRINVPDSVGILDARPEAKDPPPNRSIAQRKTKRGTVRSHEAEEAIRQASKGKYPR